jgi:hypothetical protein
MFVLALPYTVKKGFRHSPPQPGCHLPNSPWAGIIKIKIIIKIIKLFPPRESFVSYIPAGDGNVATLFYSAETSHLFSPIIHSEGYSDILYTIK